MFDGPFALALTAGMVATVNPCGFALLPAYLSAFVGLDARPSRLGATGRALAVSGVLAAGFVTVFGLIGAVFSGLLDEVQKYAPWYTIVFGLLLVGLAVFLLTGRQLTLQLPKLNRGGADGTLPSMYLFGVSYALASMSCGIGGFLTVTSAAARSDGYFDRLARFVTYGLGMGLVLTVLTIAVAFAKDRAVAIARAAIPYVNRVAGVLMLVAGAYVAYYGWYELRLLNYGGDADDPVIDRALAIQEWMQDRMPNVGNYGWYLAAGLGVIAAAVALSMRRRQTSP